MRQKNIEKVKRNKTERGTSQRMVKDEKIDADCKKQ